MKRILVLFAAISVLFAVSSCEKDNANISVKVTTLDATNVSYEGYTFNAEVVVKGLNSSAYVDGGVYYGDKPNVSKDNKFLTTEVKAFVNGKNTYSDTDSNAYEFLLNKMYYFPKGTTIYYKAYAEVITVDGTRYVYGEEKSFTL